MRSWKATDFWKLAAILIVLISALPFTAYGADGQKSSPAKKASSAKAAKTASQGTACPNPPPCGANCTSTPLQPTDCWTTSYGPAKADVIIPKPGTKTAMTSPNMLYCEGNTYALCFFSGPPTATGKPDATGKNALPCVLDEHNHVANCTCQAYTSGPNFVDINGILNQGAYFEAVTQCGLDGGRCKNIEHCWPPDDPKKQKECAAFPQANVCQYVKNQGGAGGSADPKLWPKADLISTFSFAMSGLHGKYDLRSTSCPAAQYAGCMTAPCSYGPNHTSPTQDGELVTCQCPTYNGPYQVGQKGYACSIPPSGGSSYVWSASYTVPVDAHVVKTH